MTLTIYNSLTRRQEPFEPIKPGKVQMYCCGITVYDYCHLGHARTCMIWDVVRRYLEWCGYSVEYIQNFTDIDDKILNRARQEGTTMEAVSERFIQAYFEDMEHLGVQKADAYPRATHTLDGIKRLIGELEQKGYAYPTNGDVYYAVRQFSDYGKLSGRKLDDLQAGASGRVNVQDPASLKKDPFDFALWKAAKPGEPAWESLWGDGRPGWHIECSAMVQERLGETIDLHVGGSDLIFPHHENEIAQSEAATGKPLARYWLHNGMVKVKGEKMSKSLGNFVTIRELLDKYDPMAVRLFILQTHYRKPLDFTDEALQAATNGWHTLKEGLLFGVQHGDRLKFQSSPISDAQCPMPTLVKRFQAAVNDDFNFAGGLAILFEVAKELRREGNLLTHEGKTDTSPQELEKQWQTLVELAGVLGFKAQIEATVKEARISNAEVEALIQKRAKARKTKNWAQSDRIRDELHSQGIAVIDQPGGVTKWYRS